MSCIRVFPKNYTSHDAWTVILLLLLVWLKYSVDVLRRVTSKKERERVTLHRGYFPALEKDSIYLLKVTLTNCLEIFWSWRNKRVCAMRCSFSARVLEEKQLMSSSGKLHDYSISCVFRKAWTRSFSLFPVENYWLLIVDGAVTLRAHTCLRLNVLIFSCHKVTS